jgi:hypothetical protein
MLGFYVPQFIFSRYAKPGQKITSTSTRSGTSAANAPNSVSSTTPSFSFDVKTVVQAQAQYPMAPRATAQV